MAEVSNKIIKITVDTKSAKIQIEGVEGYFRKVETAAKALNNVLDQNTQKWGRTEAALRSQIASLTDLRSKTAGTTEKYIEQTVEITRLEKELKSLTTAQTDLSNTFVTSAKIQNTKVEATFRGVNAINAEIRALEEQRNKIAETSIQYGQYTAKIDKLETELSQLTGAQKKAAAGMGSMSSSAGLAGATVNELGRTISDLPYGITAISNNISQLGSLFAILVEKTGSVNKAFKSLMATLKASPALVALLAFQAAVAIMDSVAQRSRKAAQGMDDLARSTGEAAVELKVAVDLLNDETIPLSQKETLLRNVNREYKGLNATLNENNRLSEESIKNIDKEIELLVKAAKTKGILDEIRKIYGEIAILDSKSNDDLVATITKLGAKFGTLGLSTDSFIERQGTVNRKKLEEELDKTLNSLQQQLKNKQLLPMVFAGVPDKETQDKENKFLQRRLKELDDIRADYIDSQKEFLESINAEMQTDRIKRLNSIYEIELKQLKQQEEFAHERATIEGVSVAEQYEITLTYLNKRNALYNEKNKELKEIANLTSFNIKPAAELEDLVPPAEQLAESSKKTMDGLAAYQKNKEEVIKNGNEAEANLREQNKLSAIYAAQDLTNAVANVMFASFQREIDMEKDKTNIKNNELRKRLDDENLSAEERKKIQDQIAGNDEALRVKQEAIEKKKFKLNKAASIANATVNTYLAATAALKDPALSTFQRIASMVAIIGSGLAQVAVIAKQKFVSSASSVAAVGSTGNSSASNQIQAPAFNVVGASSTNQLAETIASQSKTPIKTYVVAKDVSTAQEMERNIIGTATLG